MVDLIARLRRRGACPIRIRCAGGLNIYEWKCAGDPARPGMNRENARDVIDALRQGIVPDRGMDLLMVGQEPARVHLSELLRHVCNGKSEFKFIRGAYGNGKTFLCSWLKERAFEEDFAVSTVRIGPDMPLSDLTVFFSGLTNGLRSPEKRDATALPDILESWLLSIHRKVATLEGLNAFDQRHRGLKPRTWGSTVAFKTMEPSSPPRAGVARTAPPTTSLSPWSPTSESNSGSSSPVMPGPMVPV